MIAGPWRKSSHSNFNGNCVETRWAKSSHSLSNTACTEVRAGPGGVVQVRDSKDPAGTVLTFTAAGWEAFIAGAKLGDFDHLAR